MQLMIDEMQDEINEQKVVLNQKDEQLFLQEQQISRQEQQLQVCIQGYMQNESFLMSHRTGLWGQSPV